MAKYKQFKGSPDIFTQEGKRITEQEAQTAGLFTPQGLSPEVEQLQTIRPDITQESQFAPKAGTDITAEDLSTTPIVKLPEKTEDTTDYAGLNKSVKVPEPIKEKTPLETKQEEANVIIARAKELMGITGGKEAFEAEQRTAQGYAEKQAQIEDISAQIEALDTQAEAKKLQIEEQPIARQFIEKQQAGVSRENTIKKLNLSASLLAAQGKFNAAKLRIEQAVNAKYAKDEAELKNKIAQLEFITKYELTPLETKRKEELQAQAKTDAETLAVKKAQELDFNKNIVDAQQGGMKQSETDRARSLFEAGKIDEANAMIAPYMIKAKKEPTPTESTLQTQEIGIIENKLIQSKGRDGFVDPIIYQSERLRARINPDEFDKRFSYLLSSQERKKLEKESIVDERLRQENLSNLLGQVASYTTRDEATNELNRYQGSILEKVGQEGMDKLKIEIDRLFPLPKEEIKKAKVEETEPTKSFFSRLFGR